MFALASGRVFPAPFAVPKWLKFIFGVLLLPACAGAVPALVRVVRASGGAGEVWVPLGAGAACWLVVFALLPKPMWIYVVGHELTHVVWSWLFGGKVIEDFAFTLLVGIVVGTYSSVFIASNLVIFMTHYYQRRDAKLAKQGSKKSGGHAALRVRPEPKAN